jgi:hypothetical protein
MKNIIAALTVLLTIGSVNAFFEGNNANYNPFGHNSWSEDNGIFAYNSYDMWDPRWYSTEFTSMINEIDDDNNNRSYYTTGRDFPVTDTTK